MKFIFAIALLLFSANCSLETIGLRHKMTQLLQEHQQKLQEQPKVGGWNDQPLDQFLQQNNNLISTTLSAVEDKFKVDEQGFKFDKLVSVQTQIVAGINYKLVLDYTNAEELHKTFEVIQYVVPWNPTASKITKVQEIQLQEPY